MSILLGSEIFIIENYYKNKLISIIKEVYKYTLKATPPSVDERFIDWLLDKYKN